MLMRSPLAPDRRQPPRFIKPCQPVLAAKVPSGDGWLHELKHDGFRIVACRNTCRPRSGRRRVHKRQRAGSEATEARIKRRPWATSRYKLGRCLSWVNVKNPAYERR
jgi:hypothetical protein